MAALTLVYLQVEAFNPEYEPIIVLALPIIPSRISHNI